MDKTCKICAEKFEVDPGPLEKYVTTCGKCCDALAKEKTTAMISAANPIEDALAKKKARWEKLIPSEFALTKVERLPDRAGYDAVMSWTFGKRGIVMHGNSGTGKSRCAWMLVEREYWSGRSIGVLDSMSGLRYAASFADGADIALSWIDRLIAKDVVLMDDVFKGKLTDSYEQALFGIIDQRMIQGRPIVVTTNDTGETLRGRVTTDRIEPMLRRLRESCRVVQFKKRAGI